MLCQETYQLHVKVSKNQWAKMWDERKVLHVHVRHMSCTAYACAKTHLETQWRVGDLGCCIKRNTLRSFSWLCLWFALVIRDIANPEFRNVPTPYVHVHELYSHVHVHLQHVLIHSRVETCVRWSSLWCNLFHGDAFLNRKSANIICNMLVFSG